ncbi:hypothetical protein CIL05_02320 [Virgibacillus profundi]|uniref:DUF3137 domain-containing protein n=1 Tax=Virgibacillus profundi TaxID=2024555 RepID=A0A2A2IJ06_9BACI|nr:DUF3137 domain-containing protein [Virgibacillus profundi]PAV31512.1 hypothetical protein CIL05_02320 [Virgibacillus profundi]PXY55698.1 DUF3137 domain-containing protein [Virgibacillus profundi]
MFPSFESIYPNLGPVLEVAQEARAEAKRKITRNIMIILIMWAVSVGVMFITQNSSIGGTLIFIAFLSTFLFIGLSVRAAKEFRSTYSHKIVGALVTAMFENIEAPENEPEYEASVKFIPNKRIGASRVSTSGIAPRFDKIKGEDYISGRLGATTFEFSEIELIDIDYKKDNNGNRKKVEKRVFKGIMFIADFHKDFDGETYLIDKKFFDSERFLLKFQGAFEIEMEDIAFNKAFRTMTTDDIEARYVLSSNLMERIMEFENQSKDEVELSFKNSKMFIMHKSRKNHFEGKLFENNDEETLKQIYTDFRTYFDIVEEFRLNRRIWSKS